MIRLRDSHSHDGPRKKLGEFGGCLSTKSRWIHACWEIPKSINRESLRNDIVNQEFVDIRALGNFQ